MTVVSAAGWCFRLPEQFLKVSPLGKAFLLCLCVGGHELVTLIISHDGVYVLCTSDLNDARTSVYLDKTRKAGE